MYSSIDSPHGILTYTLRQEIPDSEITITGQSIGDIHPTRGPPRISSCSSIHPSHHLVSMFKALGKPICGELSHVPE